MKLRPVSGKNRLSFDDENAGYSESTIQDSNFTLVYKHVKSTRQDFLKSKHSLFFFFFFFSTATPS